MTRKTRTFAILGAILAIALTLSVLGVTVYASQTTTYTMSGNTPGWVSKAQNLGATDATETLTLTVWLRLHNEGQLQQQLHDMYTPGSGSYHQFVSQSQFNANYSPTSQELNSVENFLSAHGFTVLGAAENNFYVKVSGTVDQAEKAFHVQINNYSYDNQTYRSNAADPSVNDPAGGNIANITGLDNSSDYAPFIQRPAQGGGDGTAPNNSVIWQVLCGGLTTSKTLKVVDQTTGKTTSTPTYTGFVPCGYGATQLQKAYGVDKLIAQGIDGTGQTVAIVDAYGSSTILTDANAYSAAYGLPKLVEGQNFQIVSPPGTVNHPESRAQDPLGWQAEVTLDVEAVHAMAPGAKIVLVASPNNYADLDEAVNWVVIHHYADIVSNSWGLAADLMDPGQASRDERIFMQAAAEGIGVSFSSGDCGDEATSPASDPQCGGAKSVDYPASSPWVTAVGGTSLFLNGDNSYNFETGWGTNLSRLYSCYAYTVSKQTGLQNCNSYYNSPLVYGFDGGAGGGLSYNFTAQPWQQAAISGATASGFGVVGSHRAVPDVSMLADPYTGMNVFITDQSVGDTSPEIEPYGGTSLACPLFSGIMALVNQMRANNHLAPAGLATQYLYGLPAGATNDVSAPPTGVGNPVSGDASAFLLYYGSRYSGRFFAPTFNQDSSLATGAGWDDVTGVGSPNAPNFVPAMASQP
ncbi:MAG: peptidase S8 and S53, subtilisin, kexin, sedolisin [Ktedonobacterales bacterium]|jgi:subtilase family serine protease|nr:MAG: peptidase S8 and S53, subtilisin, kexin, sedolisin [Ktedonobacterales bacterium]